MDMKEWLSRQAENVHLLNTENNAEYLANVSKPRCRVTQF